MSTVQLISLSLSLSFTFLSTHDHEIYLHATEAAGCPALNAQSGNRPSLSCSHVFPCSPPRFSAYLYKLLVMPVYKIPPHTGYCPTAREEQPVTRAL